MDEPTPVRVAWIHLSFANALAMTLTLTMAGLVVGIALGAVWLVLRLAWAAVT